MAKYLAMAKRLLGEFRTIKIELVARDLNSLADTLTGLGFVFEGEIGRTIVVDSILILSHEVFQKLVVVNTEMGSSWIDPIINFLQHNKKPEDKREAHKLRIKASRFWISPFGNLYKRLYLGPCCASPRAL